MLSVYYNEFDPFAAGWLHELIAIGAIPAGTVDTRSIKEVMPDDLKQYEVCHFFAGIGGWAEALRIADYAGPVWTGSCPCQPFSEAGQRRGADDPRHLWPEFKRLIASAKPPIVIGEQVASADGREWLAGVRTDLEALAYEVGCADLCAAGVGAPTRRQRLYWIATMDNATGARLPSTWSWKPEKSEGRERLPAVGRLGFWGQSNREGRDGTRRRIEPSLEPLVNGFPNNLGIVRGAGNAINPWLAAEFVMAARESASG